MFVLTHDLHSYCRYSYKVMHTRSRFLRFHSSLLASFLSSFFSPPCSCTLLLVVRVLYSTRWPVLFVAPVDFPSSFDSPHTISRSLIALDLKGTINKAYYEIYHHKCSGLLCHLSSRSLENYLETVIETTRKEFFTFLDLTSMTKPFLYEKIIKLLTNPP